MMAAQDMENGAGDSDMLPILQAERDSLDPTFVNALKLLDKEIERVKSGKPVTEDKKYYEAHTMKPVKVGVRVLLPVKDYPKVNFVGKLLGPKGATMKKLNQDLNVRMAVMGRGSMKDKRQEEDLRKSGDPKHSHLNEDLHLRIDALAPLAEAHLRLAHAIKEIMPYLTPDSGATPPMQGAGFDGPARAPPPRPAAPFREDPYYDAPPAPAPPARGYEDFRDPYERVPPARPDYAAGAPRAYDYPAPTRERFEDYEPRGWGGQAAAGGRGAGYKPPVARGRGAAERPHPYAAPGRGAAPRY